MANSQRQAAAPRLIIILIIPSRKLVWSACVCAYTRGCGNKLIENFRLINPVAYTVVHNIIILYIICGVWLKPHLPAYRLQYARTMPRPLPFFETRTDPLAGAENQSGRGGGGGSRKKQNVYILFVCVHSFIFR